MRTRNPARFLLATIVTVMIAPAVARAADSAVLAAEDAVRQAVRERYGSGKRVVFENPTESLLSLTEVTVSGQGHLQDRSDWNFDQSFQFTVKVRSDGSSTRDLKVTFRDGRRIDDQKNWTKTVMRSTLHVTSPKWYQSYDGSSVRVQGIGSGPILIEVLDARNRRVAREQVSASQGRFDYLVRELEEGNYRVVVTSERNDGQEDEVRFSVSGGSHEWGHAQPTLTVSQPARNAVLHSSSVMISGQTSADSLRVHVWDENDREMMDREVRSQGGYWSVSTQLADGYYHFRVESGPMRESRSFRVDGSLSKKRGFVTVEEPSEDSLVNGGRLTVSGRSSESAVNVDVVDDRGRSVATRTVPTKNLYWNTSIPLDPGSYEVSVAIGRENPIRRKVRVKGGGEAAVPGAVRLRVFEPGRDRTVRGPQVTVSGNSQDDRVTVQIWDDRNNRIANRSVPCRQGYWNTQLRLEPGRYRVRVESGSGWDHEEFFFRVN